MKIFYSLEDAAQHVSSGPFFIAKGGQLFPFTWRLNGSSQCVVFCPGATTRGKPLPIFQRASYFKDLEINCVSIFDPTLYLCPSLTLGWFQGTGELFYAKLLSEIMHSLPEVLGIRGSDVLVYGTSGGGVPGFHIASSISQSKLYVSNIQTDVSKYKEKPYAAMLNVSYPGVSPQDVRERYAERLSIIDMDGDFEVFYSQNLVDQFHYERHFKPFQQKATRRRMKTQYYLYHDENSGHWALPRETELEIVRGILAGRDITAVLPSAERQPCKSSSLLLNGEERVPENVASSAEKFNT